MKRVIANAFFWDDKSGRVVNTMLKDDELLNNFLMNSFVSLYSAKQANPNTDCCLVTNIDLPEEMDHLFSTNDIIIYKHQKASFDFKGENDWRGAFYKIDAVGYLAARYEQIVLMDTDTVSVKSLDTFWNCLSPKVELYLYEIVPDQEDTIKNEITTRTYNELYNEHLDSVKHWGGEFIGGNSETIKKLCNVCTQVYNDIVDSSYSIHKRFGQEAIMSIGAVRYGLSIKKANKYISRLATGRFYSVDKDYKEKCIWHLLSEKDRGMVEVYKFIQKNNRLPDVKKMENIYHLKGKRNIFEIAILGVRKIYHMIRNQIK